MLKKKLLKKAAVIGMMATMITGCSQEVQTTHVDGLNSLGKLRLFREKRNPEREMSLQKRQGFWMRQPERIRLQTKAL